MLLNKSKPMESLVKNQKKMTPYHAPSYVVIIRYHTNI